MGRRRVDKHSERRAQAIECAHRAFAMLSEWWGSVEITLGSVGAGDVTTYVVSTPEPDDTDDDDDDDDDDTGDDWKHPDGGSGQSDDSGQEQPGQA